jgi:hypothetical protein
MASALLSMISSHNGRYFVSFVAAVGDRDPNPRIAILGPFSQPQRARREGEKWVKLGNEAIERNEPASLPDLVTVPGNVRTCITESLKKAIRERGVSGLRENLDLGEMILDSDFCQGK